MDLFKKTASFLVIIFLSIPAVWALFGNGYFPMHDDTQVARVYEMAAALRDGQFPVRWVSDLGYGYGYPIFNFYAPLPYYIGAVIHLLGFDIVFATKMIFLLGLLLAGVTMFLLGKSIWGIKGGIVSALFYMYAPYHAVQIYVRGAAGELWAYGFLPLVFLGVFGLFQLDELPLTSKAHIKAIIVGGLGLAGVVLSHNITGMLTLGFLIIGCISCIPILLLTQKNVGRSYINFIIMILLGLGLSAFFWFPALTESKYTHVHTLVEGSNDYRQHFVYPDQLWDSPWGYGGSAPGRADGMSFKIGKLHLFIAGLGLLFIILKSVKYKSYKMNMGLGILCATGCVVSILMMLSVTQPVWEVVPYFAYIQYPWRFLVFVLFFISLLAGGFTADFEKGSMLSKIQMMIGAIILVVLIGWNYKYFQPHYLYPLYESDVTPETITGKYSQISDEYLPQNFVIPGQGGEIRSSKISSTNDIIVQHEETKSDLWDLTLFTKESAEIVFRLADFPGWHAYVDTHEARLDTHLGLLSIQLPSGTHQVKLFFTDTLVRQISNGISGLTLVILGIFLTKYMSVHDEK